MKVKEVIQRSDDQAQSIEVIADGMKVVAKAGPFKHGGEDLALAEDVEYDVETSADTLWLDAFLVREVATGAITVLIDERVSDGVTFDDAYDFRGGPYEELFLLYSLAIPPNTTSLDDLTLTRYRMDLVVRPQEAVAPAAEPPEEPQEEPAPAPPPPGFIETLMGWGK